MMRRTLTSELLFALPLVAACTEGERYAAPGPDTRPTVSLDLPNIIRVSTDEAFRVSPTFAIDSTDLRFLVASNAKVGSRRVLDLSRPRHQRLLGYGTYAGRTETYRRTVMLDEYGVHSVRTAIFRANTSGEHSNVWYNHLARSLTGEIYLTQMSRWDWQDGEVNLTKVPVGAWPMMSSVTLSGYYRQSYFGLHPGIWDIENPLRRSFITTDAVAPTSGIRDCVL